MESSLCLCGIYLITIITITANLVWVAVYKGERRARRVSGDGLYFYFTWKSGFTALDLFSSIGADKKQKISKDFKLLRSEPVDSPSAFPTVLVRVPPESRRSKLPDHAVEFCCLYGFKSDCLQTWKLLLMVSTVY